MCESELADAPADPGAESRSGAVDSSPDGATISNRNGNPPPIPDTHDPSPDTPAAPEPAPARPAPSATPDYPIISDHEILGELGRGGMGVVYLARHTVLRRRVALKMIRAGAKADADDLVRFRREAEAVARLKHAHIVQIYDIGEHDGLPYFSLEFVEGGSLADKLKTAMLPPREAAELLEVTARAMHAAHEHNIIHRDLKPANILVTPEGQPKVTDFGLAKQLDRDDGQTSEGMIMGTPSYMSPEQADGRTSEIGPLTDVYALGAILYEFLTGRPPFRSPNKLDTIMQVLMEEPVRPRSLNPKVNRDLETICLKCLEKEPRKRYASAADLADDVRRFLNGEPIRARPVSAVERVLKWVRRKPATAALYAALVLLAAILAGSAYGYQYLRARSLVNELRERDRLEGLRAEASRQILECRKKVTEATSFEGCQEARNQVVVALGIVAPETSLETERAALEGLKTEIEIKLAALELHEAERDRLKRFRAHRDNAMYSRTLDIGVHLAEQVQRTHIEASAGLAEFWPRIAAAGLEGLAPKHFDERERVEIVVHCFDLLMIRADCEARMLSAGDPQSARRQAERALDDLDAAARLRELPVHEAIREQFPMRAYHQQRALCLEQLGDRSRAVAERRRAAAISTLTAADHFLAGQSFYRRGNPNLAIRSFNEALRADVHHFWARYCLGLCHLQTREPKTARAWLTACIRERPEFVWSYLLRSYAHAELKEFAEAQADLDRVLKDHPDETARYGIHITRGVLFLKQDKLDSAVADLRQAIELKPRQYQAYLNLAQVYQAQAALHTEKAVRARRQDLLRKALAEIDRAIAVKQTEPAQQLPLSLRPRPVLAMLHRKRAELHRDLEEWPAAMADLVQAIASEPAGSVAQAEDQYELARLLFRLRRYRDTVEACDLSLKSQPDYLKIHGLRAIALLEQARSQANPAERKELSSQALASFRRYQELAKPGAEDLRLFGMIRARLGRFSEAIDDYSQALALRPDDSGTWLFRGWAHLAVQAPRLALRDFEEAIRLDSQAGKAANGDAYAGRGHARALLGQLRPAVADAEEAIRRGPRTYQVTYGACRIYAQAVVHLDSVLAGQSLASAATRSAYQDRALQLLREAVEAVPAAQRPLFWRDQVQPDAALLSIRRSPAYGQLARIVGENQKPETRN